MALLWQLQFNGILEVEQHLCSLSVQLRANLFEIVPVQFNLCRASGKKSKLFQKHEKYQKKISLETDIEKKARHRKAREYKKRKQLEETDCEEQQRIQKEREYKRSKRLEESDRVTKAKKVNDNKLHQKQKPATISQDEYLSASNITKHGGLKQQLWAKHNIHKFYKSIQFTVHQCSVCLEAWPLKAKPKSSYICSRCSRAKKSQKNFLMKILWYLPVFHRNYKI